MFTADVHGGARPRGVLGGAYQGGRAARHRAAAGVGVRGRGRGCRRGGGGEGKGVGACKRGVLDEGWRSKLGQ